MTHTYLNAATDIKVRVGFFSELLPRRSVRPRPNPLRWRKRNRTLKGRPAHVGSMVPLRQQSELIEVIRTPHQAFLVDREDARPEDVEPVADDERRATIDSL